MHVRDEYATVINFTNDASLDIIVGPFCTMHDASEFASTSSPAEATHATVMVLTSAAGAAVSWLSVLSAVSLIDRLDLLLGRDEPPADDEETCWVVDIETSDARYVVGPFDGLAAAVVFGEDRMAVAAIARDECLRAINKRPLQRGDLSRQPAVLATNLEAFSALTQATADVVTAC